MLLLLFFVNLQVFKTHTYLYAHPRNERMRRWCSSPATSLVTRTRRTRHVTVTVLHAQRAASSDGPPPPRTETTDDTAAAAAASHLENWHPKLLPLDTFIRRLQCVSVRSEYDLLPNSEHQPTSSAASPRGLEQFFRVYEEPTRNNIVDENQNALRLAVAERIHDACEDMLNSDALVSSDDVSRISLLASSALRLPLPETSRCVDVSIKAFIGVLDAALKGDSAAAVSGRTRRRLRFSSVVALPFRSKTMGPEMEAEIHMAWTRLMDAAAVGAQRQQIVNTTLLVPASEGRLTAGGGGKRSKLSLPLIAEIIPIIEHSVVWASLFDQTAAAEQQQQRLGEHQALAVMMFGFIAQCIADAIRLFSGNDGPPPSKATTTPTSSVEVDSSSLLGQLSRMFAAVASVLAVSALPVHDLLSVIESVYPSLMLIGEKGLISSDVASSSSWWGKATASSIAPSTTLSQISYTSEVALRNAVDTLSLRLQNAPPTIATIDSPRLLVALRGASLLCRGSSKSLLLSPDMAASLSVITSFVEARVRSLAAVDVVNAVPWLLELLRIAVKDLDGATVLAGLVANVLIQHPHVVVEAELFHPQAFERPAALATGESSSSSPLSTSLRLGSPVVVPLFSLLDRHSHILLPAARLNRIVGSVIDAADDLCDDNDLLLMLCVKLCVAVPSVYRITKDDDGGVFWVRVLPMLSRLAAAAAAASQSQSELQQPPPLCYHLFGWAVVVLLHAAVERPMDDQVDKILECFLGGGVGVDINKHWSESLHADNDWKNALNFALRQFTRSQKSGSRSRLSRQAMLRLQNSSA